MSSLHVPGTFVTNRHGLKELLMKAHIEGAPSYLLQIVNDIRAEKELRV